MTDRVRFTVRASADPQTLPRLVDHVARLGLVPNVVHARVDQDGMTVVLDQDGIGDGQAVVIAEHMGSSVTVETVSLRRGRRCLALIGVQACA